jgi:hypothetical protein
MGDSLLAGLALYNSVGWFTEKKKIIFQDFKFTSHIMDRDLGEFL